MTPYAISLQLLYIECLAFGHDSTAQAVGEMLKAEVSLNLSL